MKKEIEIKTDEIIDRVIKEDFGEQIGLLSGTAGSLFLLSYYSEYKKNEKYLDLVEERIIQTFDILNNSSFSQLSYSNGIAGFLWTLENLSEHKYIDIDLHDFIDTATPLMVDFMMDKMENGEYDFLHGALGIANYFVNKTDAASLKIIRSFNEKLFSHGLSDDDKTMHYISGVNKNNAWLPVVNLSLSHGMASIMYYLQRCLQNKLLATAETENVLKKIIAYYLKNQNDISHYPNYFPSWIDKADPIRDSRLAWCYGDLGIGLTLLLSSAILNDPQLKKYSIAVLKKTVSRLDPLKENIKEGGICHGSSGLVKLYRNLYRSTGLVEFDTAANHWLKQTIELATHPDGYAGFKTYNTEIGFHNNCGLLEGVGGIGLVFLEELMNKPLSWEKSLMFS